MNDKKSDIIKIRDQLGVLDLELQEKTYNQFALSNLPFETYFKPRSFEEFNSLKGVEITYEGEIWTFEEVTIFGKSKVAHVWTTARFHDIGHSSTVEFPVPSDLRIRVDISKDDYTKSIHLCFNELAGVCTYGRDAHYADIAISTVYSIPCNEFLAELNRTWLSDPLYRVPTQELDEIVGIGDLIQSNYSEQKYIIIDIKKFEYEAVERPQGNNLFYSYSFTMVDFKTKRGRFYINEVVPVNGKLLKLFATCEDEIFVLDRNLDYIENKTFAKEDDTEDCIECDSIKEKWVQTTLF